MKEHTFDNRRILVATMCDNSSFKKKTMCDKSGK
jgi:hypothetical protein